MCQCQKFGDEEYTYINIQGKVIHTTVRSLIMWVLSKVAVIC